MEIQHVIFRLGQELGNKISDLAIAMARFEGKLDAKPCETHAAELKRLADNVGVMDRKVTNSNAATSTRRAIWKDTMLVLGGLVGLVMLLLKATGH